MSTTDVARRTDIDVPLTDQPVYVIDVNPHRANAIISGLIVMVTSGAMVAVTATHAEFAQVTFGALMAAVLLFVYHLARFERYEQ